MNHFSPGRSAAILAAVFVLAACRSEVVESTTDNLIETPSELEKNNLLQLPGAVYRHAADSPIHWQPWTRDIPDLADRSDRMIFAFVTSVQAPGFAESLETLSSNRRIVEAINQNYVPVLIDADAAREIGILTADLAAEISQPLNLPFLLWMSPAGHPVAWIPSRWIDAETARERFFQSNILVSNIWKESPEYVVRNSAMDNEARAARMDRRRMRIMGSETPDVDTVRSIRQLISLYDPLSRNYDEIGGLFPSGALDLIASAAMQADLPPDVRRRAGETTRDYLKDLLGSPMFDPLDGGLFSARRSGSWTLPSFHRNSITQSRAALALFRAYHATGEPHALESALGLIRFTENQYRTSGGLFAVGYEAGSSQEDWKWTVEEVAEILGEEEGRWWADLTGMRGLGNIPFEVDPERRYFRQNTISLPDTLHALAEKSGTPPDRFEARFEDARQKILAARDLRVGESPRDKTPHASASFRMVSAYAAAFTATGDDQWRDKSVELLERSREAFSDGARLRTFQDGDSPPEITDARAFTYALAIHALLDVVDITGNTDWLIWCDDLATVMTENFTEDDLLHEVSADARVIDLPVTDFTMLFEESSLGLINFAECRLAALGRPLMMDLRELAGKLPISAVDYPVQHTDITQSFLSRLFPVTIVHGPETPRELLDSIERLPLRMFHRRPARGDEAPPAGACLVIRGADEPVVVTNPRELENAALPGSVGP